MRLFVRCTGVNETEAGVSVSFYRTPSNAEIYNTNRQTLELNTAFTVDFAGDFRDLGKSYVVGQDYALDFGASADVKADASPPVVLDVAAVEVLKAQRLTAVTGQAQP